MVAVSACHEPGLLMVLARPKEQQYLDEFHHWYNTEHGPLRMRLDFIRTGYRYRTQNQGNSTTWAGVYDVDRISALAEPRYTNLRRFRSVREQQIMAHKVDILQRKICKMVASYGECSGRAAPIMKIVSCTLDLLDIDCPDRWTTEENLHHQTSIPGWRRTRIYEVLDDSNVRPAANARQEVLYIHEFDQVKNPSRTTYPPYPWQSDIADVNNIKSGQWSQVFQFYHEFQAQDYRKPPDFAPAVSTHIHAGSSETVMPMSMTMTVGMPVHLDAMQQKDLGSLHTSRLASPMVH